MFKTESRKGISLGAIFALLASFFLVAPAAQADANGVIVAPLTGTSSTMLVDEEFALSFALGQNVDDAKKDRVKFFVEKPAGYGVTISHTASPAANLAYVDTNTDAGADGPTFSGVVGMTASATISEVITPSTSVAEVNQIVLELWSKSAAIDSESPAVSVTVTVFIDLSNNGLLEKANEPYTTYVVNFVPHSSLGSSVTLTQPIQGDVRVTASAAVSGVNFDQLNNTFNLTLASTRDGASPAVAETNSNLAISFAKAGTMSASQNVASAVAETTMSATLFYGSAAAANALAISTKSVTATTIEGITASAVVGDNLKVDTQLVGDARVNSAFSFQAWPYTASSEATSTTSVAVAQTMYVTGLPTLNNDKWMKINGVMYTASAAVPSLATPATLAAGKATITVETSGWAGNESDTSFVFKALNDSQTYVVDWHTATYTLENGDTAVSTTPGSAVSLAFDIEDQWGVASANLNHRVVAYWDGDSNFSSSASTSFAVTGAKSTVNMTPTSATATGSTTLNVSLQTKNVESGLWTTDEYEQITVVVSALTGGFTASEVASQSTSISYAIASGTYSWSPVYSGTTAVGGQNVVISADSVAFKNALGATASATMTIRADANGAFTFYAASGVAGTHTISMVAGGQTTISYLVVSPAVHNDGSSISWDKTEILAGATTTITGTLVDSNGNPVATGDTASLTVAWTGKGLAFNLPTSTDADGEFSFQVLALSSELGEGAVSATYKPAGAAVSTANFTSVQKVDIVSSLTSSDVSSQVITVGTFKGYVAIYTKGYMGQKLSAKVAGKWLVVDPIAAFKSNDYSRTVRLTGAGYTITVDLYIDGAFVRSEVVTTK